MFHACAARFDVTENLENFLDFEVNKQGLKLIWKIYSFTKSQNQMTSEKKRPSPTVCYLGLAKELGILEFLPKSQN